MDDIKLQDELASAYQSNDFDQKIDDVIYDTSHQQPAIVTIDNPLNKITYIFSQEDKNRWTNEAKSKLNEMLQNEATRIVRNANKLSKKSEKTLQKDVQQASIKTDSNTRNNYNAIGFGLIGAVSSQALGIAIQLDENANFGISFASFIMLLGAFLAFKK